MKPHIHTCFYEVTVCHRERKRRGASLSVIWGHFRVITLTPLHKEPQTVVQKSSKITWHEPYSLVYDYPCIPTHMPTYNIADV